MVKDWFNRWEEFAAHPRPLAGYALPSASERTAQNALPRRRIGMARAVHRIALDKPEKVSRRGHCQVENAFLVGLSQQMAATRAMEIIANNLANLGTPGFKHEGAAFEQYMVPVQATEAEGGGTVNVSFVLDRGVVRDLAPGGMEQTGSLFDMAIDGPGYFVVQAPEGERYTRNGHFRLDGQGQVVTEDGYVVQSDGGAITLQPQDGDLRVGSDGSLSTDLQILGKLRVVTFADERALKKVGSSFYDAAG